MRHVFLDKHLIKIQQITQSVLDETALLIAIHRVYTIEPKTIHTLETIYRDEVKTIPHKIKALLLGNMQSTPLIMSYPIGGQVIAIGSRVRSLQPGDFVVSAPGAEHHALLARSFESLVTKVSENSMDQMMVLPFVARALYAINRSEVQAGDWIVVYGMGVMGKLLIQLAHRMGCRVIVVTKHKQDRSYADQYADYIFDPTESDAAQEINLATQGHGVSTTFVSCSSGSLSFVADITRSDGNIVLLQQHPSIQSFDTEHTLLFAHEGIVPHYYLRPALQKALDNAAYLLMHNKLDVGCLLKATYQLGQKVPEQSRVDRRQGCLIHVQKLKSAKEPSREQFRIIPAIKDTIRVGIIGDKIDQIDVLNILAEERNIVINAIASDTIKLKQNAFKEAHITPIDDISLLSSELLDVIVVCSTQRNQTAYALQALQHGKMVFMTTPLATSSDQWYLLEKLLDTKKIHLGVNFYRTFSPFIQRVKSVLTKRKTPLMMHYRINNAIDKDGAARGMGVGRIMNDAAHIIDLFCFLTEAQPFAISVEAVHNKHEGIFPTDNFSLQITFNDGSICSLLYTMLGHKVVGTERFEIFFDNRAIVSENYTDLYGFGLPSWFNKTVTNPDWGKQQVVHDFFAKIKEEPYQPTIPLQRIKTVAQLCLIADQLACQGGGSSDVFIPKKEMYESSISSL